MLLRITPKGLGISDVAELKYHSRYEELQLIKVQMFNLRTSAAI